MTTLSIRTRALIALKWGAAAMGVCVMLSSCGSQPNPSLDLGRTGGEKAQQSESLGTKSLSAVRANSAELASEPEAAVVSRPRIFTSRIEPLSLQKGGVAKVSLPLSSDSSVSAMIRSIDFSSQSSGLSESSVQGKVLSVVVSGEAEEGRHDGQILVRLEGGAEFVQSVVINVLP